MGALQTLTLEEVAGRLKDGELPFYGTTPLGSASFHFRRPAPVLAVVCHAGSRVRPDLESYFGVNPGERFREEDPYMDRFAEDFPVRLIARDSRFEYDLNREIDKAIYSHGRKKWGLQVWKRPLPEQEAEISLSKYREFHTLLEMTVDWLLGMHNHLILFDLHSYCYRREAEVDWWKDDRPEINLGTRSVNRDYFSPLIDLFLEGVSGNRIDGHPLRIGENHIFPGGYLTRKFAATHNRRVLVLAIEYKKIFMDEHTGELYPEKLEVLINNLVQVRDRMLQAVDLFKQES